MMKENVGSVAIEENTAATFDVTDVFRFVTGDAVDVCAGIDDVPVRTGSGTNG